jgi:peptidoglycan/LPS O-acetylase OafA/YrhL
MKNTRFSILALSALLLTPSIVSAADTNAFIDKLGEILKKIIDGVSGSNYDYVSNILSPQILFGLLIFFVIFAIVGEIKLFKQNWLKISISAIVGILAGGFISQSWIQPLLNQYESLGIAITFILPFVLMFYFLKTVAPDKILIQKAIWTVYLVVVIFNAILNFNETTTTGKWLYVIIIVLTAMALLFGHKLMNLMFKEDLKEQLSSRSKEAEASIVAQIDLDTQKLSSLQGAARKALEDKIARNREVLKNLRVED